MFESHSLRQSVCNSENCSLIGGAKSAFCGLFPLPANQNGYWSGAIVCLLSVSVCDQDLSTRLGTNRFSRLASVGACVNRAGKKSMSKKSIQRLTICQHRLGLQPKLLTMCFNSLVFLALYEGHLGPRRVCGPRLAMNRCL